MRDENIICSCAVRFPWLGRAKDLGMDGWMGSQKTPKPLGIGLICCELTCGIPGKALILPALPFGEILESTRLGSGGLFHSMSVDQSQEV